MDSDLTKNQFEFDGSGAALATKEDVLKKIKEIELLHQTQLSALQKIDIIKGCKMISPYPILKESLNISLSKEGLTPKALSIFGDKDDYELLSQYKFSDLLNYCVVEYGALSKEFEYFCLFVSEEFKQKITDNFTLPDVVFFNQNEIDRIGDKLEELMPLNIDLGKIVISIRLLCDYLETRMTKISEFSLEGYSLNFKGGAKILNGKSEQEVSEEFIALFDRKSPTSKERISEFFGNFLDLAEISIYSEQKIYELFQDHNIKIAHLFAQDGGLADFIAELHDMNDEECVANIGNKFNIALSSRLFESSRDAVLYSSYIDHIFYPIVNAKSYDGLEAIHDPLQNYYAIFSYLNPKSFISKIAKYNLDDERLKYDFYADINPTIKSMIDRFALAKDGREIEKYKSEIDQIILEVCTDLEEKMAMKVGEAFEKLDHQKAIYVCEDFFISIGKSKIATTKEDKSFIDGFKDFIKEKLEKSPASVAVSPVGYGISRTIAAKARKSLC